MKKEIKLLKILFLLLLGNCVLAQSPPGYISKELQSILDKAVARYPAKGGLLAVYKPGEWEWNGSSGDADLQRNPAQPGMLFYAGSITKNFVTSGIFILVEERKLSLDDSIKKFLRPTLADTIPNFNEVTIRQLLNHSSGIPNYTNAKFAEVFFVAPTRIMTPEDLLGFIIGEKPTNAPGKAAVYCNTNFLLAALIIEKVSGMGFHEFVNQRIIQKLKLKNTKFLEPNDFDALKDEMSCILMGADRINRDVTRQSISWAYGAGDIVSNTKDLIEYYYALQEFQILKPESVNEMKKPQYDLTNGEGKVFYGSGTMVYNIFDLKAHGHGGNLFGNSSGLYYIPEINTYVAFNFNYYPTDGVDYILTPTYLYLRSIVGLLSSYESNQIGFNCFPNPAKDLINIEFELKNTEKVSISLFDIQGREIKKIAENQVFTIGYHQLPVQDLKVPNGLYNLTIYYGSSSNTQRIIIQN